MSEVYVEIHLSENEWKFFGKLTNTLPLKPNFTEIMAVDPRNGNELGVKVFNDEKIIFFDVFSESELPWNQNHQSSS